MIIELYSAGMTGNRLKEYKREVSSNTRGLEPEEILGPDDISHPSKTLRKALSLGMSPKEFRTQILSTPASMDALNYLTASQTIATIDGLPLYNQALNYVMSDKAAMAKAYIVYNIITVPLAASETPLTLSQVSAFDPDAILRMIAGAATLDPTVMSFIRSNGRNISFGMLEYHGSISCMYPEDLQALASYLAQIALTTTQLVGDGRRTSASGLSQEMARIARSAKMKGSEYVIAGLINSYQDTISAHPLLVKAGIDTKVLAAMISETVSDSLILGPKAAVKKATYSYAGKQMLKTIGVQTALEGYIGAETSAAATSIMADLAALLLI